MLNLEYLLEEAESNGLPVLKKRAILREYLQAIILSSIYKDKFGKNFFFMGGTAMRYFYNLPRFSEDLDFNASKLPYEEFKEVIESGVKQEIVREGFSVEISYKKRGVIFTAEALFKDAVEKYLISDKRGIDLMIKIEVNHPGWPLDTEPRALSMYGYNFIALLMQKGNLLSEKVCALLNRKRGRDIYDTLFMLRKKFQFNEDVLRFNGIKLPIKNTIMDYLKSIDGKELKRLAEQVRPFLFKEDDIELIVNASMYAETFLEGY